MKRKPQELRAHQIGSPAGAVAQGGAGHPPGAAGRHAGRSGAQHEPVNASAGEPADGYRSLFENAVEGMYRTTLDGRYLDVNLALARMHGCETPWEFIGHFGNRTVHTYIDPAPHEELHRQMREQGFVRDLECRVYRRDGSWFWISETGHPRWDDEGRMVGYEGFVADISQRKKAERALQQSEARYRAIVEDQTELICRYLPDQTFTFVNDAYCRYFDKAREDLIGRKFAPLIPDEDLEVVLRRLAALNPECPVITHEHRVVAPGGEIRWHLWTDRAIFGTDGRVVEYQSVGRDITDQKSVDAQLRQAQKMEAVGQLTGGMAHDFNNLLAVIMANLELLEETEGIDDEQRSLIEPCVRSACRGAELTHRLLVFARRQPIDPRLTNVNALLSSMTDLLRRTLGESITIRTKWGADPGDTMIEPGELECAVLNLALNARDAMPDGGSLIIETRNAELDRHCAEQNGEVQPGPYVMLSIGDTGTGMSPEVLERVFEPFFTTKDDHRGSGLGLSMVYGFVKQSGGNIKIYSEPDVGSTIELYLPRYFDANEPDRSAKLEPSEPHGNVEVALRVEGSSEVHTSLT